MRFAPSGRWPLGKAAIPSWSTLLNSWGGVTIAYRRRLIDAPSYTLNHEEVAKALEEGIRFAESLTPEEVELDQYGHAARAGSSRPHRRRAGDDMPAKSILVAAGTQPNTVLGREDQHNVFLDGKWFQAVDEDGQPVKPERVAKPAQVSVLMSIRKDGRGISFFGDLHPSFAGNVVKAMASAKQGYPVVSRLLAAGRLRRRDPPSCSRNSTTNCARVVKEVIRLTPNIVEVVVEAPMAARAFQPGQFYRLQNYEALAPRVNGTVLGMEGLALTGASVDREKGLLSTIVLEMGGSSDLCALLKPGEPVILMGPTGTPTETPGQETVLLVGGGLGNAVLFSIGQQLRAQGSRTIYFAGYKKIIDRYKVEEIEKAADIVVWCCDEAPGFTPDRVQDKAFVGNIVDAIAAYGRGDFDPGRMPYRPRKRGRDLASLGGPAGRHRLGRHDGRGGARAAHGAGAVPEARSQGHRQHQFAHAVHDERDLRAVPPASQGSEDRRRDRGVLLLQPGSAAGSRGLGHAAHAALAERRAGEADQAVDRPLPAALGRQAGATNRRVIILAANERESTLIQNLERDHDEDGAVFVHAGDFAEHGFLAFHEVSRGSHPDVHVLNLVSTGNHRHPKADLHLLETDVTSLILATHRLGVNANTAEIGTAPPG